MNKFMIMGRLTRDPEVRYGQSGNSTAVARFSIAVDRKYKRDNQPDTDFFNCTAFGKQAEFAERYLHKGMKMVVIGRAENDSYTNREGNKVYTVTVMVEEMEFAESKNASAGGNDYNGGRQGSGFPKQRPQPTPADIGDGFMNIPDGVDDYDLPFN